MRCTVLIGALACVATLVATSPTASGAQTCIGDCGQDGQVSIAELITMVGIALGTSELSRCASGDRDGNGAVSIGEIVTAVALALDGCPIGNVVAIRVGSAGAAPGKSGSFSVSLTTAGEQIDAVQHELQFPADAAVLAAQTGEPDCVSTTGSLAVLFLPMGCTPGTTCQAMRITYARVRIPDGTMLYSCTVLVSGTATPGARLPLTCANASYVTSDFEELTPACIDGSVEVGQPAPVTPVGNP